MPTHVREYECEIRVRYSETDGQARVHHSNFINYFELGRCELCRANGFDYRRMEEEGLFFVVVEISCRYRQGALYDDLLHLRTSVIKTKGARITHEYRIRRGDDVIAEGSSVVACIDRAGKVRRLPDEFLLPEEAQALPAEDRIG